MADADHNLLQDAFWIVASAFAVEAFVFGTLGFDAIGIDHAGHGHAHTPEV